jgi:hypothetical protein
VISADVRLAKEFVVKRGKKANVKPDGTTKTAV